MSTEKIVKGCVVLLLPLLLFLVLMIPYSKLNSAVIVEVFGCGCPEVDEFGNIVEPGFDANDFTGLFWLFVSVCVTVISVFLSKRIPEKRKLLRAVYVIFMLGMSLLISYNLCQIMMWR